MSDTEVGPSSPPATTSSGSANSAKKKSPKLSCPECPDNERELLGGGEWDKSIAGKPDKANTEFVYYSTTLREIAPRLTNEVDRHLVIPWIRKLFRPEYHSCRFRVKRNRYLLHLVLLLMNDEAWGIFRHPPPDGALQNPLEIAATEQQWFAEWEKDSMWQEVLQELPPGASRMQCTIHQNFLACRQDTEHGVQLDEEFAFLLYLTRPYCVLLRSSQERTRAAAWLQCLCTIRPDSCSSMKQLRNEYCVAMLGYVHELRAAGPFSELPWIPLPPLADVMKILAERHPVIDPCSHEADVFFSAHPMPDEGAFCYMAISGDLLDTSLNELD